MAITDPGVQAALRRGGVIDVTTTGRRSGRPRRIYVSGIPRPEKRDWLLNLEADPDLTFHLKGP